MNTEKATEKQLIGLVEKLTRSNKYLQVELDRIKKALNIKNVSQRSELLVCKECDGKIDELDAWCKHCGEVIY